ncbi:hypothetical protein ABK040_005250 [Willaertia magna]
MKTFLTKFLKTKPSPLLSSSSSFGTLAYHQNSNETILLYKSSLNKIINKRTFSQSIINNYNINNNNKKPYSPFKPTSTQQFKKSKETTQETKENNNDLKTYFKPVDQLHELLYLRYGNAIHDEVPLIINKELQLIEKENNIKILFATELGSRCHGFNTPHSDFNIRFIFMYPKATDYLHLTNSPYNFPYKTEKTKDVFQSLKYYYLTSNGKQIRIDICGWDIRRCLFYIYKFNINLSEWLASQHIIVQESSFIQKMRDIAAQYLFYFPHKVAHPLLASAKSNLERFFKINKKNKKDKVINNNNNKTLILNNDKVVPLNNLKEDLELKEYKEYKDELEEEKILDVKFILIIIRMLLQINLFEYKFLVEKTKKVEPLNEILILNSKKLFDKVRSLRRIEIENELLLLFQIRDSSPNTEFYSLPFHKVVSQWILFEIKRLEGICIDLDLGNKKREREMTETLNEIFIGLLKEQDPNFRNY